MEKLDNFEYSKDKREDAFDNPYAQMIFQVKKWFRQNMSLTALKEHDELHRLMDKFLRQTQVFVYQCKFLDKLGEVPDNHKIKFLNQLKDRVLDKVLAFENSKPMNLYFEKRPYEKMKEAL